MTPDREQIRRDAGSWECRESEIPGESYIERGTGADMERFLDAPLPYPDAERVEALLAELEQAERERDEARELMAAFLKFRDAITKQRL